jgi:hypothetical protein
MTGSFPYRTPPRSYQRDVLRAMAPHREWYLALEQGTGKTYVALMHAARLRLLDRIDAMLVFAPNGVHTAWVQDQVPEHMPEAVAVQSYVWSSARENQLRRKARRTAKQPSPALHAFLQAPVGEALKVLAINSEALAAVAQVEAVCRYMCRHHRTLLIVDEASDFASPTARRTRALYRLRRLAHYRLCLDGTPVGGEPWDVWAQMRFLDPRILGYPTLRAMQDDCAEWVELERGRDGQKFRVLRKDRAGRPMYKNLGVVSERLATRMSRVRKEDVLPELPPKQFTKRYFECTPEQERLIVTLHQDAMATLANAASDTVTVTTVLTYLLRAQQVTHGYVPVDPTWDPTTTSSDSELRAEPQTVMLEGPNPRLQALMDVLGSDDRSGWPCLVWARFQLDAQLLVPLLRVAGYRVARYDGATSARERAAAVRAWHAGELDVLVANAAAMARGHNLQRGARVVYYGNYYGLRRRLQSEDRVHRLGQSRPVLYTDLMAVLPTQRDPLSLSPDYRIVRALRANKSVADVVLGDPSLTTWL